ncbi:MAG: hypothetical protein Q4F11_05040 [Eubacteriales bacterium]|nr:hypothetical protein [Eubacteriales bacterium]
MVHKNNMCVIYDSDIKYAVKLMNVINNDKEVPFGAQVFTEAEQLESYLKTNEPKILMVSEDKCDYKLIDNKSSRLIVLCDEEQQVKQAAEKFGKDAAGVYKYQSSAKILQSIIRQNQNAVGGVDNDTKLIGVIGADVCSRNILAITIAYILNEKKPVLYINLDEFSGLEHIFPAEEDNNLSDTFYIYKQSGYSYSDEIGKTISHCEHMDYIAPVHCADDISYMESHKIVQLLQDMGKKQGYSYVVIDVSGGVRSSWNILSECAYVYTPQAGDEWIMRKHRSMERYFMETGMEYLLDKTVKVPVKIEHSMLKGDFWSQVSLSCSTQSIREMIVSQISGDAC